MEKVTSNGTTITGKISITTEDGFRYEFAEEESRYSSNWVVILYYPTAWYLSKIISPSKTDSVMFQYETFNGGYAVSNVSSEVYSIHTGFFDENNIYVNAVTKEVLING
jgi:hypothetical protein